MKHLVNNLCGGLRPGDRDSVGSFVDNNIKSSALRCQNRNHNHQGRFGAIKRAYKQNNSQLSIATETGAKRGPNGGQASVDFSHSKSKSKSSSNENNGNNQSNNGCNIDDNGDKMLFGGITIGDVDGDHELPLVVSRNERITGDRACN